MSNKLVLQFLLFLNREQRELTYMIFYNMMSKYSCTTAPVHLLSCSLFSIVMQSRTGS